MSELTEHDYVGPQGLRVRGTVLVLPGRGETPHSYVRFGARLAADAYRVRVLEPAALPAADAASSEVAATLSTVAGQLTTAVAQLGSVDPLVRPLVLIGADTGAAILAALLADASTDPGRVREPWWPQAAVLAGFPGYGASPAASSWDEELDTRTHCPAHRSVISRDDRARGTLADAVPDQLLDAAYASAVDLPQLLLIGADDPYADQEALARAAKALPQARLTQVRGGHHDVLNDLQHRSVAAEVVTFLESLRDEPAVRPILSVQSSAW